MQYIFGIRSMRQTIKRNWLLGHGKLVDWSGRCLTPGGLALQARPWTEQSEGSGSANAPPESKRLERKSTFYSEIHIRNDKRHQELALDTFVDNLNLSKLKGLVEWNN
jgi:hypothetical protein